MLEIPTFKFALREDLKNNKEFLPQRATPGAAGWDVRCAQEDKKPIILRAGQYAKIPLGFRAIMPEGWWLELRPRSSTFAKKFCNCLYGVLDSDWRGMNQIALQYIPDINSLGKDLVLNFGEPIGQLIPVKIRNMEIQEISNEEFNDFCSKEVNFRNQEGFGATVGNNYGKK